MLQNCGGYCHSNITIYEKQGMDFTMAISFGRFAFLKLTDFTDFCKNSVACETFLWYDNLTFAGKVG